MKNVLWVYIVIIGISLFISSIFFISYPPFTALGLGIMTVGLASYAVSREGENNPANDLVLESLIGNIEEIFSYYGKEKFYRIYTPSSSGANGMILAEKPLNGEIKVNGDLINKFNDSFAVFLRTPGSILVDEMRRSRTKFPGDIEFLLKKALIELYPLSTGLNVVRAEKNAYVIIVKDPYPKTRYKFLGFIHSMIIASIIAENESKPVYVDTQEVKGNVLNVRVKILE
ncbi:hypothetical protein [Acidianus sp. RZ1]|uniref:hypothetical protein n=1 Tax=Acidianus sp. RZ1 TaxID=1540082 RepID=UPI0014931247|nr:hypothetical protein [Acidianus sp. RZ1]NON61716.1 hypothetical protein [Acidianus sp. RZ1]